MRINSAGVEGWVTGYRFGLFGQRGKGAIHDNRFGWEIKKLIKDRVLLSCFPFHQRSVSNRCRIGSHRIGSSTIRSVDVSFYSRLLSSFSSFTYRPSREKEPVARWKKEPIVKRSSKRKNRESKQSHCFLIKMDGGMTPAKFSHKCRPRPTPALSLPLSLSLSVPVINCSMCN